MRSNPPTTAHQLKKRVGTLFVAYTLSFVVVGLSYIGYSKLLLPEQFGLYSIALTIATFATLVLDGGLRSIIIKSSHDLSGEEQRTLVFLVSAFALFIVVVMVLLKSTVVYLAPSASVDYTFLATFAAAYLLSYPFIFVPTAALERRLEYGKIAWIESIGVVFERGFPVLFIWWAELGMYAFVVGSILGRLFRVVCLGLFVAPKIHVPSFDQIRSITALIKEGWWYQTATGASLVRDNLHVFIIGPWYGKEWVGYYGWAVQLCMIASQAFVQISSRISLPLFAQAINFDERWVACRKQIQLLAALTIPLLVVGVIVVPVVDNIIFDGRWALAVGFLPLMFLRMVPSVTTTPLGTLLLVEGGARRFALANIIWAICEVAAGMVMVWLLGPVGLAWSYAMVVWLGVVILIFSLGRSTSFLVKTVVRELVLRRGVLASIIFALLLLCMQSEVVGGFLVFNNWYFFSAAIGAILVSYLVEPQLRQLALHERRTCANKG